MWKGHTLVGQPQSLVSQVRSWNVLELELSGYVCYGSKFGFATLAVSDLWRIEPRCTAVPFGAIFIVAVYAPGCKKDSSRMSAKSHERDIEQGPKMSTSPATSMWTTTTTSTCGRGKSFAGFKYTMRKNVQFQGLGPI